MTLRRLRFVILLAGSMVVLCAGAAEPAKTDCSGFTLEGFDIGMTRDALFAVRPVTFGPSDEGKAFEVLKFKGTLSLDSKNRLQDWYVIYDTPDGDGVRAAMTKQLGAPISDVSGNIIEDEKDVLLERRTLWWSTACDAAMVVFEDTALKGSLGHYVSVKLARPARLPSGIDKWKTLFK